MQVSIKYKAVSELQPNGKVEVFFGECLGVVCPGCDVFILHGSHGLNDPYQFPTASRVDWQALAGFTD